MNEGLIGNLVDFTCCHDGDDTFIAVGNATFKQDFGPWKKGDKVENLTLDYDGCYIEEYDDEGEVVKKCAVKLVVDGERKPPTHRHDEDDE